MKFDIDIVMTYVDNTDPVWIKQIQKYNSEIDSKRYRKWDNLIYLFRGIQMNMSFVRNVYLVVSNFEQVPSWLNQDNVKIVLHKDIIPEKYLPTFNSTTIEMFLCKINGLADHFIYFNDDMFPIKPISPFDYFSIVNGYPKYQLIVRNEKNNIFRMQCYNSYNLACCSSGKRNLSEYYFYIKHSIDPMLKPDCLDLWMKAEDKILSSLSKFREPFNYTQYLFPDYSILNNHWEQANYDFCYYRTSDVQLIRDDIQKQIHKVICINDSKIIDIRPLDIKALHMETADDKYDIFNWTKSQIIEILKEKFPQKSKFEK